MHLQRQQSDAGIAPSASLTTTQALADARLGVQQRQVLAAEISQVQGNGFFTQLVLQSKAANRSQPLMQTLQRQAQDKAGTLADAIAGGQRNEVRLTDLLFFERHPERNGRLIDPKSEPDLVKEWLTIRNAEVRPALAGGGGAASTSAPAAAPEPVPPAVTRPAEAAALGVPVAEDAVEPEQEQNRVPESPAAAMDDLNHPKLHQLDQIVEALRQLQAEADTPTPGSGTVNATSFFRQLNDTAGLAHYQEAGLTKAQTTAGLLRVARELVRSMTAAEFGVEENELRRIQGRYNRLLNSYTPYFTQMANRNWLYTSDMSAWQRTCNLTSLAMTLQAMGIQPKDFTGDAALLAQIAKRFESRFSDFSAVTALRMPDFLQLVMIYVQFGKTGGDGFEQRVDQARRLAAPLISSTLDIFAQVSMLFGVERTEIGYIRSTGQQARDANGATVAADVYKQAVLGKLPPVLDAGGQVVVNKPGHYVRLEDINDRGLVLDDPATRGKNYHVDWAEANRAGYFRSYQVFMKG